MLSVQKEIGGARAVVSLIANEIKEKIEKENIGLFVPDIENELCQLNTEEGIK